MLAINMTADHLRSLAMYITYALEKGRSENHSSRSHPTYPSSERRGPIQIQNIERDTSLMSVEDCSDNELSTTQIGIRLLGLYADLVCVPGDTTNIARFSKAVTNKVFSTVRGHVLLLTA